MKIGSLLLSSPFILAPMDGFTDAAMRVMCRRVGASLCFTEMIPAEALIRGNKKTLLKLRFLPGDTPIAAQIVGRDPSHMAEAARICESMGADVVDVNVGCPSWRVTRAGGGAALLADLKALERVLRAVKAAIRVPMTLKARVGLSKERIVLDDLARVAVDCGADAVTIHARTMAQGFTGHAEWSWIARFREKVDMPVIGNGDVRNAFDALRMLRETGCSGVMVGRAAIGRPWLFAQLLAAWRGEDMPGEPDVTKRKAWALEHYECLVQLQGGDERKAAVLFRKHLACYVRGLRGAARLRNMLSSLTDRAGVLMILGEMQEAALCKEDAQR